MSILRLSVAKAKEKYLSPSPLIQAIPTSSISSASTISYDFCDFDDEGSEDEDIENINTNIQQKSTKRL